MYVNKIRVPNKRWSCNNVAVLLYSYFKKPPTKGSRSFCPDVSRFARCLFEKME